MVTLNINNYKVSDLEKAYCLIYENAKELLEEAEILFAKEKYARAYTLSHISSEELSKLPILYRVATNVYFGIKVNWKDVNKRLRDHEGKLRMKFISQQFLIGSSLGFVESPEFIEKKAKIYNDFKNVSFYAGIYEKDFIKPSQIITKEIAEANIGVTKYYFRFIELSDFHIKGFTESLTKINKGFSSSYTGKDMK